MPAGFTFAGSNAWHGVTPYTILQLGQAFSKFVISKLLPHSLHSIVIGMGIICSLNPIALTLSTTCFPFSNVPAHPSCILFSPFILFRASFRGGGTPAPYYIYAVSTLATRSIVSPLLRVRITIESSVAVRSCITFESSLIMSPAASITDVSSYPKSIAPLRVRTEIGYGALCFFIN